MDLRVEKSEFIQGLYLTQGVVEKRNTLPILANVLIESTNNEIVLTATGIQDVANSKRIAGRELGRVTGLATGARIECVIANPNPADVNVRFKLAVR